LDPLIAIVTGAGRGLGRAMTLGLVAAGIRVLGTAARESGELQALEAEIRDRFGSDRFLPLTADVTHPEAAERTVATALEHWGRLDMLINNAGRGMKYVNPRFLTDPLLSGKRRRNSGVSSSTPTSMAPFSWRGRRFAPCSPKGGDASSTSP